MPRVGRHPLKGAKEFDRINKDITVCTIIHAPVLDGYWSDYLDILDLFFNSLYQSTSLPFDLMVFDNGSCSEVKDFLLKLQDCGKIQYLTLSKYNLRKTGALKFLLTTAPGEIVAYSDCDVFFLPGWLENSIEILNTYPKAGKVTAMPIAMNTSSPVFNKFFITTLIEASEDPLIKLETGSLVKDYFIKAHAASLDESLTQYQQRLGDRKDYRITKDNIKAFISGADFQFLMTRKAINDLLPFDKNESIYDGDAIYHSMLEQDLADKGYWQLSSDNYLVHHMGNQVPNFNEELTWVDPDIFTFTLLKSKKNPPSVTNFMRDNQFINWLKANRIFRRYIKKLYRFCYKMLYD